MFVSIFVCLLMRLNIFFICLLEIYISFANIPLPIFWGEVLTVFFLLVCRI